MLFRSVQGLIYECDACVIKRCLLKLRCSIEISDTIINHFEQYTNRSLCTGTSSGVQRLPGVGLIVNFYYSKVHRHLPYRLSTCSASDHTMQSILKYFFFTVVLSHNKGRQQPQMSLQRKSCPYLENIHWSYVVPS